MISEIGKTASDASKIIFLRIEMEFGIVTNLKYSCWHIPVVIWGFQTPAPLNTPLSVTKVQHF